MASMSKLDYLKRYMDSSAEKNDRTQKKKKKKIKKQSNIKIIDSSISLKEVHKKARTIKEDGGDEYDLKEEKPLVYAEDGTTVLTEEYNRKEKQKKERWKSLGCEDIVSTTRAPTSGRHDSSDSDDDFSPKRRNDTDSDLSPIRRTATMEDSDQDLSPVRKGQFCSEDEHSPERNNQQRKCSGDRKSGGRIQREPKVLSTDSKAGLKTGAELRSENELKRDRERAAMNKLDSTLSGKDASTVHRDKSGRKVDLKLEAIRKRKAEEEKLEHEEQYATWGKGLAQGEDYKKQLDNDLHEMQKPLARHRDDEDLDVLLKGRERDGDPMASYVSKNKGRNDTSAGKPRYSGPVVPNRFNIWPGYRWDGVDRSNGFEKQRFMEMGKRKGLKDAAYKWSVEDM